MVELDYTIDAKPLAHVEYDQDEETGQWVADELSKKDAGVLLDEIMASIESAPSAYANADQKQVDEKFMNRLWHFRRKHYGRFDAKLEHDAKHLDFLKRYFEHNDKQMLTPVKKVLIKLNVHNLRPIPHDERECLIDQPTFNEPSPMSLVAEEKRHEVQSYFKFTANTKVRLVEL